MKNLYLPIAIIAAAVVIGGVMLYTNIPKSEEPNKKEVQKVEFNIEERHTWGNAAALVTIVEFSDFQCSYCQRFHPTVKQITTDYPDQVRWVYKHFPLDQIHSNARPAAEASECAAEQEKFWEFADGLFENQSLLDENLYKELAGNLGLDMEQFDDCLVSRKYKDRVEADYQEGIKIGVRGTPGNFINGLSIPGAVPYATLKTAVENALDKNK